jgi:two-component system, sensor histidine kinase and response regulator
MYRNSYLMNEIPEILIVDDNPENLQVLGKQLQEKNYSVEFAIDGKTALSWIDSKEFDLILLDINMPGMSGFEVCQQIRANPQFNNLPVIFLSADNDRESILKGFEMGGQDYITKPFDSRELLARIRTHVELKKSMARLEIEKQKAQSADRLKSAFLATMSHELRTPLNSIIGFTGILIRERPGPLNDEQKKQLGMIQNSSRHLLSLINDVLDISKIEAGQLKINIGSVDICEIVNKVIETSRPLAEKKSLYLNTDYLTKIKNVDSDSQRIFQILMNLVGNAVKFTERGGITVKCVQKGAKIKIAVHDTGPGIDKDKLDLLFKPFTQLDTGLTRKYEGTGLGLSISKRLSELLNGDIEVESQPGEGSVFSLILPGKQNGI